MPDAASGETTPTSSKAGELPVIARLMEGKRGLIMGVANERSIAWGIAQTVHAAGAELAFTYQGGAFGKRVIPMVEKLGSKIIVEADVENEASLIARLSAGDVVYDRLRALGPLSTALRRVLNAAGISVVDVPVLANGRLELRYYLREQALSQTVHRYGNVLKTYRQT